MYRYSSPREAIRNYFSARRGPKAARQRWTPRTSGRDYRPSLDGSWVLVGVILHGETEHGGCGIELGSPEERIIRAWAEDMAPNSWLTIRAERTMRDGLREAGLMSPPTRVARDADGNVREY